jgi:hypothetical protein
MTDNLPPKKVETESKTGTNYFQFASVETPAWQSLPDQAKIMVSITNGQGKYGKSLPYTKKAFLECFFLTGDNIFQMTVRVVLNEESQLAQLTVLDQAGEATTKTITIGLNYFHQNFQRLPE